MSTPGFIAEASLYKASGRYRTDRSAITLRTRMNSVISPTMEKIEVHGCAPGSYLVDNGDGTWDCWSNPDPWWGSGGGPGVPAPGEGGGPGAGELPERPEPQDTKPKPPKRPAPPVRKPYHPKEDDSCHAEFFRVQGGNQLDYKTEVRTGRYQYSSDPKHKGEFVCDDPANSKIQLCRNNKWPIKGSNSNGDYDDWYLCFDGHR